MECSRSALQSKIVQESRREAVRIGKPRCSAIPPCSSQADLYSNLFNGKFSCM
jgi:hypothetical protein